MANRQRQAASPRNKRQGGKNGAVPSTLDKVFREELQKLDAEDVLLPLLRRQKGRTSCYQTHFRVDWMNFIVNLHAGCAIRNLPVRALTLGAEKEMKRSLSSCSN
nr:hypothetical protein Iba_chr11bCG14040 [Ipomoea batatas]